jgi:hypothetical protein
MAYFVNCPSCGKKLRIADGVQDPGLTCPHCLKAIINPGLKEAKATKISSPMPQDIPTVLMTCPECEKLIRADWSNCVHCGTSLAEPRMASSFLMGHRSGPWVENDVRRDTRGTGVGVILLAILGGIGLIPMLAVAGTEAIHGEGWQIKNVLISIGILALITMGYMINRYDPEDIGVGRVAVGTLALIGAIILFVLALWIVVVAVCVVAVMGSRH